jgi:hypothetical protein
VVEELLVAALLATASKVMAAVAETAKKAVQTNEAMSARALRAMKRVSFRVFILFWGYGFIPARENLGYPG